MAVIENPSPAPITATPCNPHTTQGVMPAVDDDNAEIDDDGEEIVDRDVLAVVDGEWE